MAERRSGRTKHRVKGRVSRVRRSEEALNTGKVGENNALPQLVNGLLRGLRNEKK